MTRIPRPIRQPTSAPENDLQQPRHSVATCHINDPEWTKRPNANYTSKHSTSPEPMLQRHTPNNLVSVTAFLPLSIQCNDNSTISLTSISASMQIGIYPIGYQLSLRRIEESFEYSIPEFVHCRWFVFHAIEGVIHQTVQYEYTERKSCIENSFPSLTSVIQWPFQMSLNLSHVPPSSPCHTTPCIINIYRNANMAYLARILTDGEHATTKSPHNLCSLWKFSCIDDFNQHLGDVMIISFPN